MSGRGKGGKGLGKGGAKRHRKARAPPQFSASKLSLPLRAAPLHRLLPPRASGASCWLLPAPPFPCRRRFEPFEGWVLPPARCRLRAAPAASALRLPPHTPPSDALSRAGAPR